jgi:hypothetical protein
MSRRRCCACRPATCAPRPSYAAALKQADIGVAMGSGSEVTKEAAKIVLTDDNFATLVRAVDLGRDIYRRISTYIKIQLTDQLPGWADGQCRSRHARSAGSCRRRAARRAGAAG